MSATEKRTAANKEAFLAAIVECEGIIVDAAQYCGVNRHNHHHWIHTDPEYKKKYEELSWVKEVYLDHVEGKQRELIDGIIVKGGEDSEGEPIVYDRPPCKTSIIFYLKTQGKHRGYVEKNEIDVKANVTIDMSEWS